MKYNAEKGEIFSDKIINELDRFVINFIGIMEKYTDYVLVSGYVPILLGRSRASEDVDLLIPEMAFSKFEEMFKDLISKGYECANTSNVEEAYNMLDEHAIRFFKDIPIPNMEFKKITNKIQKEAFDKRIKVILKEKILFISPLELQIAYKLSLVAKGNFNEISSDKDFEDAKHLYETFKQELHKDKLFEYTKLFKVEDMLNFIENEISETNRDKNKNFKERIWFIKYWANFIKTHPDKVWSKGQAVLIDSQIHSAKHFYRSLEKIEQRKKILSKLIQKNRIFVKD